MAFGEDERLGERAMFWLLGLLMVFVIPQELDEAAIKKLTLEMQQEVEALRGWKFKEDVKSGIYSEEQVKEFMRGPGEEKKMTRAHKIIGLIPKESKAHTLEDATDFIPGGIYDHDSGALYVVKREGKELGLEEIKVTILHELVHAMDDQHFNLGRPKDMSGHSSDGEYARCAIAEGAAILLQERYKLKCKGKRVLSEEDKKNSMELFKAPLHLSCWVASFPLGARFLLKGDQKAMFYGMTGKKDVGSVGEVLLKVWKDVPKSMEQLLHPEKYWNKKLRDDPVKVDHKSVEALLKEQGMSVEFSDTVGELKIAILCTSESKKANPMMMMNPNLWTNKGASGWGGDSLFLISGDKPRCLWVTVWDEEKDRDEFLGEYEIYRDRIKPVVHKLGQRGVVFLYGFKKANALKAGLVKIRFTKNGKAWSCSG